MKLVALWRRNPMHPFCFAGLPDLPQKSAENRPRQQVKQINRLAIALGFAGGATVGWFLTEFWRAMVLSPFGLGRGFPEPRHEPEWWPFVAICVISSGMLGVAIVGWRALKPNDCEVAP
jgi:hypothetical protein